MSWVVGRGRGSWVWVVGRGCGSWVWVNVVGKKKSSNQSKKLKIKWQKVVKFMKR